MIRAVILLLLIGATSAWAEFFDITAYDVDITVRKDSVLEVTETIDVVFHEPRHGIFRTIPYRYEPVPVTGERAKRTALPGDDYRIDIFGITVPGHPHKTSKKNGAVRIRIGDPDAYVSGRQQYVITYTVYGAVNRFSGHDELIWNVIGTEWDVPIERGSFRISLPGQPVLSPDDTFTATGTAGMNEQGADHSYRRGVLTGQLTSPLAPGEGLTAGLQLPKGFLEQAGVLLRIKLFVINNRPIILVILAIAAMWFVWYRYGRDAGVVSMVHFHPPDGMTPAEAGVLINDSADTGDLVPLIFSWAARGIITIEESDDTYLLKKTGTLPQTAKRYEHTLFDGLFPNGTMKREISELKDSFYPTMNRAEDELRREIEYSGDYEPKTFLLRKLFFMIGAGSFIGCFGYAVMTDRFTYVLVGVVLGFGAFMFGKYMPKKSLKGLKRYQAVLGFKEFIRRAERDQLRMLLDEDPLYFDHTLPYAMVFGEVTHWGNRFEGLITEPPTWYTGTSPSHSPRLFAGKLEQASTTMASTMTSAPKSTSGSGGSGFSSGGGSSGGGFGGGGGGSW